MLVAATVPHNSRKCCIASFGLQLDNWAIVLVLGLSLCSTLIGYSLGSIKQDNKPNHVIQRIKNITALLFSSGFVFYLLGVYGIIFIFAGLFLAKTLKTAEAPEELGLIGLASIPLIRLFKE